MHLPYESSGDIKKDQNDTDNVQNIGIIIENEMKKNESETNEDISTWPDSFVDISIEETTDAINRKCLNITALKFSKEKAWNKALNFRIWNKFSICKYNDRHDQWR